MFLEELVPGTEIETFHIERKAMLNRDDVQGWLKTIAGFSNAQGGVFFIGVEDATNKLIGFSRKAADNERNFFNNQVNEHIFPRPDMRIDFIRYENRGKELFVIRVDVFESPVKPIILKFKNIPSIYMRRDGFTNGATYEEIIQMSIQSRKIQFDITDSDEDYERKNFKKLFLFYAERNNGKELTDKALSSIGFFTKNKKLKNGALLFSDKYADVKTQVQCSVFSGFNKGSERIITINKFNGNITDSIFYITDFVKQRMNHTFIKLPDGRKNIDAYPERALFEGAVNAVAHRDYFLDGTQIQVDMFKDRLEISSPGSFFQGEKIGKTYNLSNIISKRRNELICAILVKCKLMEAAGTGFDKIIQEYKTADEKHNPFIYSSSDHFTLVLPDLTFEAGIKSEEVPVAIEFIPPKTMSEYDEKILSYCFGIRRKAGEIAAFLNLTDSTYFRKNILDNLVRQKYLIKTKTGNTHFYQANRTHVKKIDNTV